eukprot:1195010-Prorocentrum_minimum.AAC.8
MDGEGGKLTLRLEEKGQSYEARGYIPAGWTNQMREEGIYRQAGGEGLMFIAIACKWISRRLFCHCPDSFAHYVLSNGAICDEHHCVAGSPLLHEHSPLLTLDGHALQLHQQLTRIRRGERVYTACRVDQSDEGRG